MARTVEEIMTRDPRTVNAVDPIIDAARVMRDADIGDVVVIEDGQITAHRHRPRHRRARRGRGPRSGVDERERRVHHRRRDDRAGGERGRRV